MSELIVVTIIVAAEGGVKVPKITSREELTKALNKLGALRSEQVTLLSVESVDLLFLADDISGVLHVLKWTSGFLSIMQPSLGRSLLDVHC